jgi:hypothetical protein
MGVSLVSDVTGKRDKQTRQADATIKRYTQAPLCVPALRLHRQALSLRARPRFTPHRQA